MMLMGYPEVLDRTDTSEKLDGHYAIAARGWELIMTANSVVITIAELFPEAFTPEEHQELSKARKEMKMEDGQLEALMALWGHLSSAIAKIPVVPSIITQRSGKERFGYL